MSYLQKQWVDSSASFYSLPALSSFAQNGRQEGHSAESPRNSALTWPLQNRRLDLMQAFYETLNAVQSIRAAQIRQHRRIAE